MSRHVPPSGGMDVVTVFRKHLGSLDELDLHTRGFGLELDGRLVHRSIFQYLPAPRLRKADPDADEESLSVQRAGLFALCLRRPKQLRRELGRLVGQSIPYHITYEGDLLFDSLRSNVFEVRSNFRKLDFRRPETHNGEEEAPKIPIPAFAEFHPVANAHRDVRRVDANPCAYVDVNFPYDDDCSPQL